MKKLISILLLILLPTAAWSWSEYNHCHSTAEALKLIEDNDSDEKYKEIYHTWGDPPYYYPERDKLKDKTKSIKPTKSDHPSVQASWAEDAGDTPATDFVLNPADITVKLFRDFRHFGGESQGLKWEAYFPLRDTATAKIPKPLSGNRYISARDWAFSGSQGDKMNFQGAIEAHNYYTSNGLRESYYRMGHVLHLLQDQAEADHALLKDHSGSAKNEVEANNTFYICEAQAAQVAEIGTVACLSTCAGTTIGYLICIAACEAAVVTAAGIAYGVCEDGIDANVVGYERLAKDYWDFDRSGIRQNLTIKREKDFDAYFKNMADESIKEANDRNLDTPLGLYPALLPATFAAITGLKPYSKIPGIRPNIDTNDSSSSGPYLEMIDKVLVSATNRCAGLLQDFYEIANHPPYIQEVVVLQENILMDVDKVTGQLFPVDPDLKRKLDNVRYLAWWECSYDDSSKVDKRLQYRELKVSKSEALDGTSYTYVVVRVTSNMKRLILNLKDSAGADIYQVEMDKVASPYTTQYGVHYCMSPCCDYPPTAYYIAVVSTSTIMGNASSYCGDVSLEFTGEDMEPHYSGSGRTDPGEQLDSKPGTIAVVNNSPPYDWINAPVSSTGFQLAYEPGTDKNHTMQAFLPDPYEDNDDLASAASIKIDSGTTKTFSGLSFDEGGDKDFFSLEVPINPACNTSTQTLAGLYFVKPSFMQIYVTPDPYHEGAIMTFTGGYQKTFTSSTAYPAMFLGVENIFPSGKAGFSVEAKPDSSKQTHAGCYSMTVDHTPCKIEHLGVSLPDWITDLVKKSNNSPGDILDIIDPSLSEKPKGWLYPANPQTLELISTGETPSTIPPEYFIIKWPQSGALQILIRPVGPGQVSGTPVPVPIPMPTPDSLTFRLLDAQGEVVDETRGGEDSQIVADDLDAGVYALEITGDEVPALYSVQFLAEDISPPVTGGERTLTITSASLYDSPGDDTIVHLSVDDAADVAGVSALIKYDADLLVVGDVIGTDLISGMNLVVNASVPGEIRLEIAGTQAIESGSGALVDIGLSATEAAQAGTETTLELSDDTEIYDESGTVISLIGENGIVKFIAACVKGDVNGDGNVRSNDAILALRIAAELMEATDAQECAADMSDDGRIRSNDAILILRKAAGLAAPGINPMTDASRQITVTLAEAHGVAGETVTVPLKADNIIGLAGGDICIAYDSSVLRAVDVSSHVSLASNIADPGVVRIAFADTGGLDSEMLAEVHFRVLADDVSALKFRNVELYDLNAMPLETISIDREFTSWAMSPESSALLQNFPNPFNPETWIPYQLKEDGEVTIRIHNAAGELVRKLELGYRSTGIYVSRDRAAYWDGRNAAGEYVASGVYFYSIRAGDFTATRKLIVVK